MGDLADVAVPCCIVPGVAAMSKLRGGYTAQVDAHGHWIVTDHVQRNGYRICFSGTYEQCKAFAARGIAS